MKKMIWLAQNIGKLDGIGLIYTGTRIATETYAKWLQFVGVKAIDYNAGLDADTRRSIESGLMQKQMEVCSINQCFRYGNR